jgi:outer membrane protein OmpA-like peptidoglycan-associated protein/tetratricopeptide (TPR) repeat protein
MVVLLIASSQISAQIKQANFFFEQFKYSKAIPLYKKATDEKDQKVRKEATVRLADCYRLMNNANEARMWYAKAVAYKDVDSINWYYLGMALRTLANYDEAEKAFLTYAEKAPSDFRGKVYAQYCRDIKQWEGLTPSAEIKNAFSINSPYSDFGPAYYQDGIVFTSDRDIDMMNDKNYLWTAFGYLEMYSAQPSYYNDFWSDMAAPVKLSNTFNQPYHDGPASFTDDFKQIFITRTLKNSAKKDSNDIRTDLLKIFYADLSQEKKVTYQAFPFNSEKHSVGHPTVSADGKTLIFSSNMKGGLGQSDLYVSRFVDGKWTDPENLGDKVNTFGNELFPFLANDSTLFFSSDGHLGFGGLDLYETNLVNGQWITPWNLKLPLNSPYDDFSLVFNKNMTEGFFSSNRPGGVGADDIYAFKNYRRTPPTDNRMSAPKAPMAKLGSKPGTEKSPVISGYVKDKNTSAPLDSATVFVLNTTTNEVLVLKTNPEGYFETPVNKEDLYIAKAMKPDFFDDCLNFRIPETETSLSLKTPRDLLLDKYALNQVFVIENIYYDLDKWFIREDAKPPLDNLVRILKQYPISVELGSHTDSRASYEYNIELSQKRAEAAVRYITFNGINPMRITAKGYGETMLVNKCADGVPCTEPEHQANRRTEFKITAINATETGKKSFDPNVFKAGDIIPVQLLDAEFFNGCLVNKTVGNVENTKTKQSSGESTVGKQQVQKNEEVTPVVKVAEPVKNAEEIVPPQTISSDQIWFAVQLAAATKPIAITPSNFKGETNVQEKKIGIYYKYFSGNFTEFDQASKLRKQLLAKFPGAFVVAFKGDSPIPVDQARK